MLVSFQSLAPFKKPLTNTITALLQLYLHNNDCSHQFQH